MIHVEPDIFTYSSGISSAVWLGRPSSVSDAPGGLLLSSASCSPFEPIDRH